MNYTQSVSDYIRSIEFNSVIKSLKDINVDKKLIAELVAAGLIGFGVIYFGKIWSSYGFFKKMGIKTPSYKFFYGNLDEILDKGFANTLVEWTNKYGKTYGYFEGHLPILVTSDLEIIDELLYKQFANFTARKTLPLQGSDNSPDLNVFSASRTRWKRLRTISNQAFSPAKLKEMLPAMRMCSDRLITHISNNLNTEMNITELIDQVTMDAIWNCMFGININFIQNPKFEYYVKIAEMLKGFSDFNLFLKILTYLYELKPIIIKTLMASADIVSQLNSKWVNPFFWLMSRINEMIDERIRENKETNGSAVRKCDFIQLLLSSKADNVNLDFDNKQYESGDTKLIEKRMTKNEILISVLGFMVAGFETTSATINICLYILLTHPEELEKLKDEVDNLESYDYDSINKLKYMDMFLNEVLRMYPVGMTVQNRRCTKATTLKGIDIPEDLLIAVDVLSLHYDPEYWPGVDPNVFYPLRFASDVKYNKLAYMPFGAGPRTCVGMKFALLEIKLTLAKLVKTFDISSIIPLPKMPQIKDDIFPNVQHTKQPLFMIFNKRNY